MPIFDMKQGFKLGDILCHCIDSFCRNKVQFPFVCNIRIVHVSFSVLYFQFILVHKDCYLFIELIGLKLKDSLLSCIRPYFHLYWQIKNSILHPLFQLFDLVIVYWKNCIFRCVMSCFLYKSLKTPLSQTHKNHYF